MNPFDIINDEDKKKKPTPPPVDSVYLRTEIQAIWRDRGGDVELDVSTLEDRAARFQGYQDQCQAYLILYKYAMKEGTWRQKRKALSHLNMIKLFKAKADFSFSLLTSFKIPPPPFSYHLCKIAEQRKYWLGINDFLSTLGAKEEEQSKTNPPTPDWELSTTQDNETQST